MRFKSHMMKTLTTLTAAATIAVALTAAPSDAFAQRPSLRGAAIGLGILGGIAAGAIIGGAIANSKVATTGRAMWFSRATRRMTVTTRPRRSAARAATGRAFPGV